MKFLILFLMFLVSCLAGLFISYLCYGIILFMIERFHENKILTSVIIGLSLVLTLTIYRYLTQEI